MSERVNVPLQKASVPTFTAILAGLLQRTCACGQHSLAGGKCEECRKQREGTIQRSAVNATPVNSVPPIVHEVLSFPGQPLDAGTRAFMEPRFGHDFSQVRVHTNARAAESARAVNALAYTVGRDVVFQEGIYEPETGEGRRLLAHELTHVVQQGGATLSRQSLVISSSDSSTESEADEVAEQVGEGKPSRVLVGSLETALSRKMAIDDASKPIPNPGGKGVVKTNAETVEGYLKTLCSGGGVTVDKASGEVGISGAFCTKKTYLWGLITGASPAEKSSEPAGCTCICDMVNSKNMWHIQVDDASWPHTSFDDYDAANCKKPGGSGGRVTTPSPNSPKLWGAGTASGKALDIDPWLVLGHELCGHGWLGDSGKHCADVAAVRGEGGHQETVKRENELRKEHGIELRGTFKDPNCGESYWRDKASPATVNWSSFRSVCEAWRADYNKKHGTSYTITDRIP